MKRWLIVAVVVLLIALPVYIRISKPKLLEVTAGRVTAGAIEDKISASGTLKANKETRVAAKAGGKIVSVRVAEGQNVVRGQLLARLDRDELLAQLKQAQAVLASAQARLAQLEAGSREQEIKSAEAALSSAKANRDDAKKNYERIENLFSQSYATQQQRDSALSQKKMLESQVQQLQENLNLIKNKTTKYDVRVARASVEQAKGQIQLVNAQLKNMTITAPHAGVVAQLLAHEGEVLPPGAPVAVLADMSALYVETNVDEADIGKVHPGKEASVRVGAYTDKPLKGVVDSIAMQSLDIKERGITFLVKIRLVPTNLPLRLGMTAEIDILLRRVTNAVLVPLEAVTEQKGKSIVYVIDNGAARRTEIATGISDDEYMQALSGISAGQMVVVSPLDRVKNGMKVKVLYAD